MEFVIIFIITLCVAFFMLRTKNKNIKKSFQKKEEIITDYENRLKIVIEKNKHNKTKLLNEKKQFLLECNSELSRNIFFTDEEAKKVIEKLLKL